MFVYCLWRITLVSAAWVTQLIQQGASAVLEINNVRETSPDRELCWLTATRWYVWGGSRGRGEKNKKLWHLEWPSVQSCSLKRMLKWFFFRYWTNAWKRNPICHFFTLHWVENWDTPRRQANPQLAPSPPSMFPPHSRTYSCVCVIESDKQGWGANASAAVALTPTWGPLERRPDWQVVITSGFQLHLPSAPLGSATTHRD